MTKRSVGQPEQLAFGERMGMGPVRIVPLDAPRPSWSAIVWWVLERLVTDEKRRLRGQDASGVSNVRLALEVSRPTAEIDDALRLLGSYGLARYNSQSARWTAHGRAADVLLHWRPTDT